MFSAFSEPRYITAPKVATEFLIKPLSAPDVFAFSASALTLVNEWLVSATSSLSFHNDLGETVEKLQTEYNKKVKYQNLKCSIILQELILRVVTFIENDAFVAEDNLVVKVIDYIRKHYKENPSNQEIGKHFGYHPNHLNSIVVKYSGESIHSYLMSYKMSKALDLLMTTNLSVKQIALSLNIQDQQYFSRCFKKIYGKQPSSFRS